MTVANIEAGGPDDTAPKPQTGAEGPDGSLPAADADPEARRGTPSRPDRACYLVLGMHRSGTSSVAGTLVKLGVAAPAHLLGAQEGNETGHWESQPLIWFHDELLASAGSRWDDWRSFNLDWYDTPVAAQFKERANHLLDEEFGDAPLFVFKDPRNCRLARFWLEIFAERGIAPKIVLPIRSPLEVARSHHARDGFPLRKGLLLWLRHTLDAEAASRDLPRAVVEWDAFLSDWPSTVAAMESTLGAFPANTDLAAAEIDRFLRNDLKHQHVPQEELAHSTLVHDWVAQAYSAMCRLACDRGDGDVMATLDQIRAQFEEASNLFGGVLADAEVSLSEAERRIREVEEACGDARAQLETAQRDRDAQTAEVARLTAINGETTRAREEALTQLVAAVQAREFQHAEHTTVQQFSAWQTQELAQLQQQLNRVRGDLHERNLDYAKILKSRSWFLTKPLRAIMHLMRGTVSPKEAAFLAARSTYRSIPPGRLRNIIRAAYLRKLHRRREPEHPNLPLGQPATFPLPNYITYLPDVQPSPASDLDVSVSVVIPTYNAGSELYWLIKKLSQQRGLRSVEIVVVDSGSTDDTKEIALSLGCKLVEIEKSLFTHSYARNVGADASSGEVLLFTVQDAYPIGDNWLSALVSTLLHPRDESERLAALSCAEFPRSDTELLYNALIDTHYEFLGCSSADKIGIYKGEDNISLRTQGQLSDIACLISRETFQNYRYHGRYAEDLTLGIKLIRDGHKIAMLSSIKAIHSHNRPASYYVRRVFVDVIFLKDAFSEFSVPQVSSVKASALTADLIDQLIQTVDPARFQSPVEYFDAVARIVRGAPLPNATEVVVHPNGFEHGRLAAWLGHASVIDGKWINDPNSFSKDATQVQQMFLDRLSNLRAYVDRVYLANDESVSLQLADACRKTLAMTFGAQLSFFYLSQEESLNPHPAIASLRELMLEGI